MGGRGTGAFRSHGVVTYVLAPFALVMLVPGIGRADNAACASAYSSAQDLRATGKLKAAMDQLKICAQATCPAFITHDCTTWLTEVEATTPTFVFTAKDAAGNDLLAVRVIVDGQAFLDKLDGLASTLDPGPHVIRFESANEPPIEKQIIASVADKNRAVEVTFEAPKTDLVAKPVIVLPTQQTSHEATTPEPPPLAHTSAPVAGYVMLFGVGGVGVVVTTVFGLLALGNKSSLDAACGSDKTSCPASSQSDISSLHTNSIVSDVGLGVGIVGVGVGVILLLLHKGTPAPSDKAAVVRFEPRPSLGGSGLRVIF
jgi:hypothetical protein